MEGLRTSFGRTIDGRFKWAEKEEESIDERLSPVASINDAVTRFGFMKKDGHRSSSGWT